MKSAGRLGFALAVMALAGCGGSVDATHSEQSCAQDSECVPVYSGALCQMCGGCPNAAINATGKAAYDKDFADISASCPPRFGAQPPCVACSPSVARCQAGRCVLASP